MYRTRAFIKRNFTEMLRDPIIYIFCLGFPVVMLILFQIINNYTNGTTPIFDPSALVPGIMMFSFTFVMLSTALLSSKDKQTSFLRRLYTSPMKAHEFVIGYAVPGFTIGLFQSIVCILFGWIINLILNKEYISFSGCLLVILSQIPMLLICVFFGIIFGSLLNDKSAPGLCSVFISGAGILGGCWMPLDAMGGFEKFCKFLPFYPSVTLGRIFSGAYHSDGTKYAFDSTAAIGLIPIAVFLILGIIFSFVCFKHQMSKD